MSRRAARLVLQIAILAIFFCLGCGNGTEESTKRHGIDPRNFDPSCEPCRDFYQVANGTWLERNSIPAEDGSWSTGHEVYEHNNELLCQAGESMVRPAGERVKIW